MSNKGRPRALGGSLSSLLKSLGIERKVKEHEALARWPEVVGAKVADICEPERVKDGILFVKVKSSSWRNELFLLKAEILERLNRTIGAQIIQDIRFR